MFGIPDQLLITLAGNAISGGIMLLGGLFVLFQNIRKTANQLFFFLTLSTLLLELMISK
jgi:hypothetical protein